MVFSRELMRIYGVVNIKEKMMIKNKVQQKLEKEYAKLESEAKWLDIRKKISAGIAGGSLIIGSMAGVEGGVIMFIFFGIPFGILFFMQGLALDKKNKRINELEQMLMSSKD
jgi:hypothetical protein